CHQDAEAFRIGGVNRNPKPEMSCSMPWLSATAATRGLYTEDSMSSINKVILVGRAGKDAEVRQTQTGQSVANFSLATSEQWKDAQGERQERTEWHTLVAWGKLADVCGEYVHKGTLVYAEGRLQTREYDDRDGNPRRATKVIVNELRLLGGP